jgi:hypothetical protein
MTIRMIRRVRTEEDIRRISLLGHRRDWLDQVRNTKLRDREVLHEEYEEQLKKEDK